MADEPKEQQPSGVPAGDKPAGSSAPTSTPPAKAPAAAPPAAAPPKPAAPPPPKPPVQLQTPLNNELVGRVRAKFAAALLEAIEDRKQAILTVECGRLAEVANTVRLPPAARIPPSESLACDRRPQASDSDGGMRAAG